MCEIDTDEFCEDLAKAAAKQLRKLLLAGIDVTADDMVRLQDATSLFSPYTYELIVKELKGVV